MTPKQVDAIEAAALAACDGDWQRRDMSCGAYHTSGDCLAIDEVPVLLVTDALDPFKPTVDFIADSRRNILALVAEVRRLTKELEDERCVPPGNTQQAPAPPGLSQSDIGTRSRVGRRVGG